MRFRWLPDPECYTHPRLSWLIQCLFDLVLGRMFRVEHDLPEDFRAPPGALVMSNHLRDADAPIVGALLFRRRGLHLHGRLPYFAMREDLFQREGLANLLYAVPRPMLRLLAWIPLGWLFANVRTLPMRRLREFTWHDVLRELAGVGQGAAAPAQAFNRRGQRELARCLGSLPARVDAINPWRMGHARVAGWGLRRLSPDAMERLAPAFRGTVTRQLAHFARLLDDGQNVFFAPEGGTSPDGRLRRIRAGTWRLLGMTSTPPPVLFFVLSYDSLAPGRTRVLVRNRVWRPSAEDCRPRAVSEVVRKQLGQHRVVTPSHLLAWFLCQRPGRFRERTLTDWLQTAIGVIRETGPELDPLFARRTLPELVDERLRWLRRKRLVRRRAGVWYNAWPAGSMPGWLRVSGQVRYLANAFADMAPEAARRLSA